MFSNELYMVLQQWTRVKKKKKKQSREWKNRLQGKKIFYSNDYQ